MSQQQPIRYGDVFPAVTGELAREAVAPRDAAMMQTAENLVTGQTQKGGPAATMHSAADRNEQAGLVGHGQASPVPGVQGVAVTETDIPGRRIITESVGGQVVGGFTAPGPLDTGAPVTGSPAATRARDVVTVGEALEAAALSAGNKPVDRRDAAAVQAAEMMATGLSETLPGGVAAQAQSAAVWNERTAPASQKTTLGDALTVGLLGITF
ncbi:hypothetical protein Taro_042802 [Colocasia esculenta]|uniref:SMP domain-containing protein n=1 Tax=Colocasia esculenta TaxID=4460 RepID=A0A843WPS9_COLES|nr:hypothetical protein [Colocasia esculenta]